jgi:HlyD family secretion protein
VTARWLLCLLGCAACDGEVAQPEAGEPARTVKIERGGVVDRQLITGELRAASSASLTVPRTDAWQLTVRWLADDGSSVKAGDKVLEFDNSAVTAQLAEKHLLVLEAAMTLRATQDLVAIEAASKTTELRQRQIALEKATVLAGVPAELLPGRDAQERQLAKKRAEVAVAKAEHELEAQRKQAALDLKIKQIEHDKAQRAIEIAEQTIADLVLTAPRDGLLVIEDHPWGLGRKIRAGDTVHPGATVASVPDLTRAMQVHGELSDVDDGRVAVGMTGTCTLDAYPADPIACTVKDITPVARSKGEASLRRTFAIVLDLARTDAARMRPGMSVKVMLAVRTVPGAIAVPRGAIAAPARGDDKTAARVRMATGELRAVTLGACNAQACAVETGLAEGEVVVVGGSS